MLNDKNKQQKLSDKPSFSRLVLVGLVTVLISVFFVPVIGVFAADRTVETVPDDCRLISTSGENSKTMPDSFAVGKCLSTKGQREGGTFLPKSIGASGTAATESNMSTQSVLVAAIDVFVKLIATLSLIVFIVGAFLTIISNGSEDLLGRGKTAMIYSVIGLAVAMLSFIIVSAVQSLFFTS